MKKLILSVFIYSVLIILIVPIAVTDIWGSDKAVVITENDYDVSDGEAGKTDGGTNINKKENVNENKVSEKEQSKPVDAMLWVQEKDIEGYIKGVVGAEMPALFEEEALKAQAVAARTYAVRKINEAKSAGENIGSPDDIGQAYLTKEQLKDKWGIKFNEYYKRVSNAVDATKDEIMVYNNEPILAVFHSTSAGHTENAENVWNQELPYLKSVASLQDENAPGFETKVIFNEDNVISKLQNKFPDLILTDASLLQQIQIVERTSAGYIKSIQVGNKMFTGKEVRELLGLRSSDFYVKQEGDNIIFITKGYGHGAGMSQYGANFMAKEGCKYNEILKHYYQNIDIQKIKK